jgi:drug/metabolite transporter (DMT)-like permease
LGVDLREGHGSIIPICILIHMTIPIGIPRVLLLATSAAAFVLCWSSGFIAAKVGTVDTPLLTLLLWRFVPLAVALTLVMVSTGRARSASRPVLVRHVIIGLCSQVGYVVPIYGAVALGVASGTTALVDAVQPLLVATLLGPLLGVRVRGVQWAGLVLGAIGVALVVLSQAGSAHAPPWAYVLPVVAMASLIVGTLVERRLATTVPVPLALAVHTTAAAAVIGVLAIATGTAAPPASVEFWATTLFIAAVPTLGAYSLYWALLSRIGITALNALLFLVAPTTALAGAILFGEPLGQATVTGFALCATGVAMVLWSEARHAPAHRAAGSAERSEPREQREVMAIARPVD